MDTLGRLQVLPPLLAAATIANGRRSVNPCSVLERFIICPKASGCGWIPKSMSITSRGTTPPLFWRANSARSLRLTWRRGSGAEATWPVKQGGRNAWVGRLKPVSAICLNDAKKVEYVYTGEGIVVPSCFAEIS